MRVPKLKIVFDRKQSSLVELKSVHPNHDPPSPVLRMNERILSLVINPISNLYEIAFQIQKSIFPLGSQIVINRSEPSQYLQTIKQLQCRI